MSEELSKRDKLAIAGYAAPRLRSARARPIKAVDADGNVVREISSVEMAEKVLQRVGIEFDSDLGEHKLTLCKCGRKFLCKRSSKSKVCSKCKCVPCTVCGRQLELRLLSSKVRSGKVKPRCPLHTAKQRKVHMQCSMCDLPAYNSPQVRYGKAKPVCLLHKGKSNNGWKKPTLPAVCCSFPGCTKESTKKSVYASRRKATRPMCVEHCSPGYR